MTRINRFINGRTPPELYQAYLGPGLFEPWADRLIDGLPENGRLLDLATGTGIVARRLAAGHPGRRVEAVDVAPPMLAMAARLTDEAGLADRIGFTEASAGSLPYPENAFAGATCQQGLQFFPNKVAALSELKRVCQPGAPVHVSVWTAADDGNPVFGEIAGAIARHLGDDLLPLGPFAYGDAAAFADIARKAGLDFDGVTRMTLDSRLPPVEDLVLFDLLFLGRPAPDGALQPVIDPDDTAGDAVIDAMISELDRALAPLTQADGQLRAPMTALVLKASA